MNELAEAKSPTGDFQGNSSDTQAQLELCAQRIEVGQSTAVAGIMQIGQALCEARELLPSDNAFGDWCAQRLPDMNRKTRLRFMQVWQRFGRSAVGHNVPPTVLYQLATPSTPDDVVADVLERAEYGESISVKEVERLKKEALAEQRKELVAKHDEETRNLRANIATLQRDLENEDSKAERDRLSKQIDSLAGRVAKLASAQYEHEDTELAHKRFNESLHNINLALAALDTAFREVDIDKVRAAPYLVKKGLETGGTLIRAGESLLGVMRGDIDVEPDDVQQNPAVHGPADMAKDITPTFGRSTSSI